MPLVASPLRRWLGASALALLLGCQAAPKAVVADAGGPVFVPPVGCLILNPNFLEFGDVVANTTHWESLAVNNRCDRDVSIRIGALAGPDSQLFALNPPSDSVITLKDGETIALSAEYAPLVASATPSEASFSLSLCERGAHCEASVSLRATAVASGVSLDPSPLDFCFVPTGQSLTLTLTLSNIANYAIHLTADPRVLNQAPGGPTPTGPFQPAAGFPTKDLALFPGQSLRFPVTFTPPESGQFTGELDLFTDDGTNPDAVIPLNGYGGGAKISCAPLTLDFGSTAIGTAPTLKVACTNVGTSVPGHPEANLFIPGPNSGLPALSLQNRSDVFRPGFDPPFPAGMLLPGETATIDVSYVPSPVGGVDADTLIVSSNDCTNPRAPVALAASGVTLPTCDFQISPAAGISFGDVGTGSSAILPFVIANNGSTECLANAIQLAPDSDPAFSLPDYPGGAGPASTIIFPTGWLEVSVRFAPTTAQATFSGAVSFTISDPQRQHQSVLLSGSSLAGCLRIDPSALDFGRVGFDSRTNTWCKSNKRTVTLRNICADQDVTVDRISVLDLETNNGTPQPEFMLWGDPSPVTIPRDCPQYYYCAPTGPVTFQISFEPYAQGKHAGGIQIEAPDSFVQAPYLVSLVGDATTDSTQTDEFVGRAPALDILWVVDTAHGGEAQQDVIGDLANFLTYPMQNGFDLHMATTSTDVYANPQSEDGRMEPCPNCKINGSPVHVVTLDTGLDDAASALGRLLDLGGGASCNSNCNGFPPDGQLLEATYEALSPALLSGYNQPFYRPDASLAVIVVNSGCGDDDWSNAHQFEFYYNAFLGVKGAANAEKFSLSYVSDFSCAADWLRNMEVMAQLTGGVVVDLQNTGSPGWVDELNAIWPQVTTHMLEYPLSGIPVITPLTITVWVNGQALPQLQNGFPQWSYDDRTNSVVFAPPAAPQPPDQVKISYTIACGH